MISIKIKYNLIYLKLTEVILNRVMLSIFSVLNCQFCDKIFSSPSFAFCRMFQIWQLAIKFSQFDRIQEREGENDSISSFSSSTFFTTHGVLLLTRGFQEFNFGGIETEMNLDWNANCLNNSNINFPPQLLASNKREYYLKTQNIQHYSSAASINCCCKQRMLYLLENCTLTNVLDFHTRTLWTGQ